MKWKTVKEALRTAFERIHPNQDYNWLEEAQISYIKEGFRVTLNLDSRYTFNGSKVRDFKIVNFQDKDLNEFIHRVALNDSVDTVYKDLSKDIYYRHYHINPILRHVSTMDNVMDDPNHDVIIVPINKHSDTLAYGLFSNNVNGFQTFKMLHVPSIKVNLLTNITGSNVNGSTKYLEPITPLDYIEEIIE